MSLGGGGHARVLLDALQTAGQALPDWIIDNDSSLWGMTIEGVPVPGGDDRLPEFISHGAGRFFVGVGSSRDATPRRRLFEWATSLGLQAVDVIHERAVRSRNCTWGPGVQLMAGSIVGPGAVLGMNVLINTAAVVEHDCQIADHVHIATGARLCGQVKIGERGHVGAGAVVIQGVSIGSRAVIGAGAVVIRDVLEDQTVVGVPARPCSK